MSTQQQSVRTSYRDRVADVFRARPNEWIDARDLEGVGGRHAWRTRVSDCRFDYGMQIDNRVRRDAGFTISEYRYTPENFDRVVFIP